MVHGRPLGQWGPSCKVPSPRHLKKASGPPQPHWQTTSTWASKGGFVSYFRSLTTSQDLAPGRSPRSMHRAILFPLSQAADCWRPCLPGTCTWLLTPQLSCQCPQLLLGSEREKSLKDSSFQRLQPSPRPHPGSYHPACTEVGLRRSVSCQLSRAPTMDSLTQSQLQMYSLELYLDN